MAGHECHDVMFYVPVEFGIAIGFSFFSYADHITFGVIADKHIPEPQLIVDTFLQDFSTFLQSCHNGQTA